MTYEIIGNTTTTPVAPTDLSQVANALKGTAIGDVVSMTDVSPLEHNIKVQLSGDLPTIDVSITPLDSIIEEGPWEKGAADYEVISAGYDGAYDCTVAWIEGDNVVYYDDGTPMDFIHAGDFIRYTIIDEESGEHSLSHVIKQTDASTVTLTKYGKNLFAPFTKSSTFTAGGTTFSVTEGEPYFVVNGAVSYATGRTRFKEFQTPILLKKGVPYTLSIKVISGSNQPCNFFATDVNNDSRYFIAQIGVPVTYTPTEDMYVHIGTQTIANSVYENQKMVVQLEVGKVASDYEEYKGEQYTPNPDGTVDGVTSLYPTTTLFTDTEGVNIEAEYNRDINKLTNMPSDSKEEVLLYIKQTLTDEQKAQARDNIGAAGNTELIDIRTGADGTVYQSAGEAVRGQFNRFSDEIEKINQTENIVSKVIASGHLGGVTSENLVTETLDGYYVTHSGGVYPAPERVFLSIVTAEGLVGGTVYNISLYLNPLENTNAHFICFYDSNGKVINQSPYNWSVVDDGIYSITVPSNATSCKFNVYTENKDSALCVMVYEENAKKPLSWLLIEEDNLSNTLREKMDEFIYTHSVCKPMGFVNDQSMVAFGDSITFGITSPNLLHLPDSAYIKLFADKLGLVLTNKAISGSTITNIDGAVSATNSITNQIITNDISNYDIIFISGGCNDYTLQCPLGEFGDTVDTTLYGSLARICNHIETNKKENAKVIFITPIQNYNDKAIPLNAYRNAIFEVATAHGFNVVDGSKMGFPVKIGTYKNAMMKDLVHPTIEGHRMYANSLLGVLC